MSMQLASEKLLEREITKFEDEGTIENNKFLYSYCKRELAVIQKLKINVDLSGNMDEFKERIENEEIYFMQPQEFKEMAEKARKYDEICKFISNKQEG